MRVIAFLLQCLMALMILGIGVVCSVEGGSKAVVIGIICAITYLVSCRVGSKFAFSRREFYTCNRWELICKKVGLGTAPAFVVFLILYFILFASWE